MKTDQPPAQESQPKDSQGIQFQNYIPEKNFDDLASLAAVLCDTPIAAIRLVDCDRQWIKAWVGPQLSEFPLKCSFFAQLLEENIDLLVVPDTLLDERFRENEVVTSELRARFYAGMPLVLGDGTKAGSLCVFDTRPRELSNQQRTALTALRNSVVSELELRRLAAESNSRQAVLFDILHQLSKLDDTDAILRAAVNAIVQLGRWQSIGISVPLEDGEHWQTRAESRMAADEVGVPHSLGSGVIGRAQRSGEIQLIQNVGDDPDFFLGNDVEKVGSELAVPVKFDGQVLAVLNLESDLPAAFSPVDVDFAQSIAEIIAIALQNARRLTMLQKEIRQREQVEISLRVSEENYRSLIENSENPVGVLDRHGRILYANPAGIRIWNDEHLVQKTIFDIFPAEYSARYKAAIEGVIDLQESIVDDVKSVVNGREMWFRLNMIPLKNLDEKGTALLLNAWDVTERKLAEEQLRYSETALREAQLLSKTGSWEWLIGAETPTGSDGLTALLSGDPHLSHLTYDQVQACYPPDNWKKITRSLAEIFKSGTPYQIECEITRSDGIRRWVISKGQPMYNEKLQIIGARGTIQDITELKLAELALEESRDLLETRVQERTAEVQDLYDNAPCGYITLDHLGQITRVNNTLLKWLGYTREEMLGRNYVEMIPASQAKLYRTKEYADFYLHGGEINSMQFQVIRRDGTQFPILANANSLVDEQGRFIGTRSTVFDITERKQVENNLRESETENRLLFEESPDPLVLLDSKQRHVRVNHAYEQLVGLSRAVLSGKTPVELGLISIEEMDRIKNFVRPQVEAGAVSIAMDYSLNSATGAHYVIDGRFFILVMGGQMYSLVGGRDITIKKKAQDALRQANLEMERALRLKDEFLSTMSHELRTPLTGILGLVEILLEGFRGELNEHQKKFVRSIDMNARHLLSLVNDILDLSKIEAGRVELTIEPVIITEICQASLAFVKEQALKKELSLVFSADPTVSVVQADQRRLKQILINLLSNAVKFTHPQGKIVLGVHANADQGCIEFSVTDNGIGITPEDVNRLFTPFTQVDSALSRQYDGTGLGLALVKRMAELHGGSISVTSEPGRGSCFTVSLPWQTRILARQALQAPSPESHEQPKASPAPRRTQSILLVEDNEVNAITISEFLIRFGFSVDVAENGPIALDKIQKIMPELILMDIQLPGMDGLDIIRQLRADSRFNAIPIIALTALAMPGDRERCLQAGANEYLSKPFSMKELGDLVTRLLKKD